MDQKYINNYYENIFQWGNKNLKNVNIFRLTYEYFSIYRIHFGIIFGLHRTVCCCESFVYDWAKQLTSFGWDNDDSYRK